MALFKECTKYIAASAGSETLYPVSDLNSAEHFSFLSIVKRKKSFWLWKKDKHIPTQLKLEDILLHKLGLDESQIKEKVLMTSFFETPTFAIKGDACAKIATELSLDLQSSDEMKISLNIGDIQKGSVNWEKLQEKLQNIQVNMDHPLFSELKKKKKINLSIVLECLSTKEAAEVEEDTIKTVSTDDGLPVKKFHVDVNVNAKGSLESKVVHSFDLPPGTILAYSCNAFSIDEENKIHMHTSVDSLDSAPEENLLENNTTELKKVTEVIRSEFLPLLKSNQYEELKAILASIVSDVSIETYRHLHMLLSLAQANVNDEMHEETVTMETIDPTMKSFKSPCKDLLEILGFVVPENSNDPKARISMPKGDKNRFLKLCAAYLDCAEDVNDNIRSLLKEIPKEHLKIILQIVENELNGKDTIIKEDLKSLFQGNEKKFLKTVGFVDAALDDVDMVSYIGENRLVLLDLYAVLYAIGN